MLIECSRNQVCLAAYFFCVVHDSLLEKAMAKGFKHSMSKTHNHRRDTFLLIGLLCEPNIGLSNLVIKRQCSVSVGISGSMDACCELERLI